jgi:hypothetical protein
MGEHPGVLIGKGETSQRLLLKYGNRHGLIAGATGTGKTVTLQILAEGFSQKGTPVFMADVKGDLSGICQPGQDKPRLRKRAAKVGMTDYSFKGYPTIFWDLFGVQGHPIRATISDMGPILLARLLELNEVQEGVLNIAFKLADDQGLLLLDLKDLKSLLTFVAENSRELTIEYGTVRKVSVGAIQRRILILEQQGAENFFGEPAIDIQHIMGNTPDGKGYISVLAADELMRYPRLYSTFMLWLMSELFEELPEVGDPEKPRIVFFFDEAHLLFDRAPRPLLEKIEQVARLIRSKGVGVYFISQNPLDIPYDVLGQLGNRVQHALRAFTPRDQKAVRVAAETFRPNPRIDTAKAITELEVGEALVSTLDPKGAPTMVQRTLVRPPSSRMGPITSQERSAIMAQSPVKGIYEEAVDRDSAFEILQERAAKAAKEAAAKAAEEKRLKEEEKRRKAEEKAKKAGGRRQSLGEAIMKSAARSMARAIGTRIVRGILGSIFRGR